MELEYKSLDYKLKNFEGNEKLKNSIRKIINLNFDQLKDKYVTDSDFIGWNKLNIDYGEFFYKNYLYLNLIYPNEKHLPPSVDIDDFWHGHILDTQRYYNDCLDIFGKALHHSPYFGYGTKSNEDLLSRSFEITQNLHKLEFGNIIYEVR